MRAVFGLVLVAGVGLAGLAVFKVKERVDAYQGALAHARSTQINIQTTDILVVTSRLSYGQKLTAEHVRLVKWPVDSLPEGTFSTLDALFPDSSLAYRSVARIMEVNEPVLNVKVSEPGKTVGIQSQITPGLSAFTIRVDAVSGVSGFLHPGALVDVYWTGESEGEGVTQLIQNAVRIVAIDQQENAEDFGATIARTITVEGTRQQVTRLAQAQASGRLTLSLLNESDELVDPSEVILTRTGDLLGEREQAEQKCYVTTGFGANKVVTDIERPCPD